MGKKQAKKVESPEASSSEEEVQVEQPKADKKRKQAEIAKPEKKDNKAEKKGKKAEKEEKKPEKKDKKAEKQAPAAPTPSKKEKNGKAEKKEAKKEKKAPPPPPESSSEDEEEEKEEEKDEVEEEKEESEDAEEEEKDEEDGNDAKKPKFDADAQGEVFLSNCPETIDDSDINTLFDGMTIHNIKWLSKQGVFSGRGFVKLAASDVTKALKLSGTEIKGSAIEIALPKNPTNVPGEAGDVKVIFMGNLPFSIEESQIRELFADCGEITEIRWGMRDGEFKGYAHVEFDSNANAQKAVALTGTDVGGREVRIDLSLPRVGGGGGDRGGRGGFGGGRGRGGFGGDRGGRGGFGGRGGGGRGGGFGGRGGGGRGGRGGGGFSGTRTTF